MVWYRYFQELPNMSLALKKGSECSNQRILPQRIEFHMFSYSNHKETLNSL